MLVDRIVITHRWLEALRKIAEKAYPNEGCALLAGSIEADGSSYTYRIMKIIEVENSDRSSISFSIRDEDLINAYEMISRSNMELVGIFHTHPFSNAYPSGKDLRYMQINPVPWIILGEDGEMRAFIIDEGKGVKELRLSISD